MAIAALPNIGGMSVPAVNPGPGAIFGALGNSFNQVNSPDYQAQQMQNTMARLQMLSQIGYQIPGMASNPQYINAVKQTFSQMGLSGMAPIENGQVNVSALGTSPLTTYLQTPNGYNTMATIKDPQTRLNAAIGMQLVPAGTTQIPAQLAAIPFTPFLTSSEGARLDNLAHLVYMGDMDATAAIDDILNHADALKADNQDPQSYINGIISSASSPAARARVAQTIAKSGVAQDQAATYMSTYYAKLANVNSRTSLNDAQTSLTNIKSQYQGSLMQSEISKNNAQATEAYASAQRATASANETNYKNMQLVSRIHYNATHNLPLDVTPKDLDSATTGANTAMHDLQIEHGKLENAIISLGGTPGNPNAPLVITNPSGQPVVPTTSQEKTLQAQLQKLQAQYGEVGKQLQTATSTYQALGQIRSRALGAGAPAAPHNNYGMNSFQPVGPTTPVHGHPGYVIDSQGNLIDPSGQKIGNVHQAQQQQQAAPSPSPSP